MAEAEKFYNSGDLIYTNDPFVYVLLKALRDERCDYCFNSLTSKRIQCIRCSLVTYCSGMCQKKARWEHKRECTSLKNLPEDDLGFIRVLGKVVLKLQLKNGDAYFDMVGPEKRTFNNLTPVEQDTLAEKDNLPVQKYTSELRKYLGEQILLDDANLRDVVLKVKQNLFWMQNYSQLYGFGVYIGASAIRHSCIPNAMCTFKGTKVEIRAIKTIPKEEQFKNVTVSYRPLIDVYRDSKLGYSQLYLECINFFKACRCEECSLPSNKSVLRKVLKKSASFEAITKTVVLLKMAQSHTNDIDLIDVYNLINECLKLQKGVLAMTHILHLKTITLMVTLQIHIPDYFVQLVPGVIHSMKKAFGELSPLLVPFYDMHYFACLQLDKFSDNQVNHEEEKLRDVCRLHGNEEYYTIVENVEKNKLQPDAYLLLMSYRQ